MARTIAIWIFHGEFFWTSETIGHHHQGQITFVYSVSVPILPSWIVFLLSL
jgi:hypothetical protein